MVERAMSEIEQRILAAVKVCLADGLEPRSVYLTPEDFSELAQTSNVDEVGGLSVKHVSGKGQSRIYCRFGIARQLPRSSTDPRGQRRRPGTLRDELREAATARHWRFRRKAGA